MFSLGCILCSALPLLTNAVDVARSSGTVIALWNGNHTLVRRQDGTLFNATFMTTPPSYGDSVEISGLPEFDCFQVNLTSAVWRRLKSPAIPDDAPPIPISADDIFRNEYGHEYINSALRGKLLRLEGLLQRLPAGDDVMLKFILHGGVADSLDQVIERAVQLRMGA